MKFIRFQISKWLFGVFQITTTGTAADCAYSAIALANVAGVADTGVNRSSSSDAAALFPVSYTTTRDGGFVVAACVNNGYSPARPAPAFVSGNANQTLFSSTIIDTSGHLHTYGEVPAAGTYVDNYQGQYQRNALVALAFTGKAINPNPPVLLATFSGNQLSLSWPDHAGWTLQMQTTSPSLGLGTSWVDVPGSAASTSTNFIVDPATPAVFYRLKLEP